MLFPGSSGANYATKAGYPIIVVPFGMVMNYAEGAKGSTDKTRPFGVSFVGAHCQDPSSSGIAYAFEQATRERVPPPRMRCRRSGDAVAGRPRASPCRTGYSVVGIPTLAWRARAFSR